MDITATRPDALPTLVDLKPGAHLCSLYETEEEHRALLTPFLRQGLERGEKVLYIVDARTAEAILAYLRNDGLDVEPFLQRGQLQILTVQDAYLREGIFDPDRMIALLQAETDRAVAEGYPALRVTGEMTWALRGLPGSERLIEYEAKLNNFLPDSRCLALCQYDRRRFTPEVQLDILATHPMVVVGTELHDNPYYLPPAAFLAKDRPEARLEQWLNNLAARKQTEEALRASEETFRAMSTSAQDAVILLDVDGKITFWNQAAERIFGYPAHEVLGREMHRVCAPERFHEDSLKGWDEFRLTGKGPVIGKTLELAALRRDGVEFPVELSVSAVKLGGQWNAVGILRDITERKQMEQHAQRIEQLASMGQLLGGVVHELKNPLFVVTGRLQLLKEKLANREYDGLDPDLQKIGDAAQRMGGIAQRFLTLARPIQPSLQVCSITTVLKGVLDFLSNELMKARIKVIADYAADLPPCLSDPAQLHQAFLNLMMNALQAMAQAHGQGVLKVSAQLSASGDRQEEQWIEVRIQDDGPGIPPEHRAKLFEPFFTTKPPGEGTGLGLWTVQMIVQSLNGTVTYETEVGRGTTFVVRLPVANETTRGHGEG
ncbi:MAG: PAS domain S-box protein [Nitrospirae bacterium]|nr:MAG: PAS domain S-box protein [Nitrospirota bacterium]